MIASGNLFFEKVLNVPPRVPHTGLRESAIVKLVVTKPLQEYVERARRLNAEIGVHDSE